MAAKFKYPTGFTAWASEEQEAIQRVIASGQFTYGPETEALEEELAAYHSRNFCVATNSGSSANLIAIAALFHIQNNPLHRGDFAVVPSIAWATTWSPLILYGLDLIVADVDETWNVPLRNHSPARLIVSCPILGNPAHVADWSNHAQENSAYCIEDACESIGAVTDNDRKIGTLGDISTISMFMSHQISGIEGGAILTDDVEINRLCRMIRSHGWTRDVEKATKFEDEYRFEISSAFNVRPLEINSAVQREQLKKLAIYRTARRQNWNTFVEATKNLPITTQVIEGTSNPFGMSFTLNDPTKRAPLVAALRASGVDCRLPTGGSFTQHLIGKPWADQATPNADRIHRAGMFLGNAPWPIPELIEGAVKVMKEVLE